jgi:hypothetical protein
MPIDYGQGTSTEVIVGASYQKKLDETSMYAGDRPLDIVKSGEWPETIAGGEFMVLNELYDAFLQQENMLVKLCFKRLGIYSFGGFGASADTEGGAVKFDDSGGDVTFDSVSDIKNAGLDTYMMIPVNPADIQVNHEINVNTYKTIFFAELATLSGLKLRRFTINSFFPYRVITRRKYGTEPIYRPEDYIRWITDCMDNKIILAFKAFGSIASGTLPYMKCFIESFDTTLQPNGEVSYTLKVCEYIDYRKNLDMRKFVMEGETLIVSPKPEQRDDGKFGLGDLVNVTSGMIYTDALKRSPMKIGSVVDSFFRYPPAIVTTKLFSKSGKESFAQSFQLAPNIGASVVYNLVSNETITFIAELIKSALNLDLSEIWMIIGGDYFNKYHGMQMEEILLSSLSQIENFVMDIGLAGQNVSHGIKIRSMKDGRIGWVDKDQLKLARI